MHLESRIQAFVHLGSYLRHNFYTERYNELKEAELANPWFTQDNIKLSIDRWSDQLNVEVLKAWLNPYKLSQFNPPKRVLVIMAGNIPLVGFHDFLSVIISGNKIVVKLSSNDNILLPLLINKLIDINPDISQYIELIDDVKDKKFDGVIATGSDNSAKYFEYYFKKSQTIIRSNRKSVALLDGTESDMQLRGLADDVFGYFGLGCRSVSKVFLPEGYDLDRLFEAFYSFKEIIHHQKYTNNYDYNKAVFLIGKNKVFENGFLILKEEKSFFSPIAVLFYEYYKEMSIVEQFLKDNVDQLQCIVSKNAVPFGSAQKPNLWDYADGIDTIDFLKEL
tara:strand:- start:267 stop:1271 length:1005 start_codon:yes stop_codon:yes gene_type:complete